MLRKYFDEDQLLQNKNPNHYESTNYITPVGLGIKHHENSVQFVKKKPLPQCIKKPKKQCSIKQVAG